jgi:hypothetical protein
VEEDGDGLQMSTVGGRDESPMNRESENEALARAALSGCNHPEKFVQR